MCIYLKNVSRASVNVGWTTYDATGWGFRARGWHGRGEHISRESHGEVRGRAVGFTAATREEGSVDDEQLGEKREREPVDRHHESHPGDGWETRGVWASGERDGEGLSLSLSLV